MRYKIGVYTRVSTEEQALRSEGSLETQRHRILAEIENRNRRESAWGKVVDYYHDDGVSAAEYRPDYERLMRDVRKGKINMIFVADYFRFCRNLLDYLQLAEHLKEIGAKILSVKDNFDTETAMGQSMIRNYINMAQTERELTAERVATNFHARGLRGLRNGGRVLYGLERNDKDLARLTINEKEAAEIRQVFRVFIEEGTCAKASDRLTREHSTRKTKNCGDGTINEAEWTRNSVHAVLRNPAYAGLREVNRKNKDREQATLREFERYHLVPASWPAIVDEVTWKTTQESLDFAQEKARTRLATKEKRDFLLTGLLHCAECGGRLMGATGHGTKSAHRYYIHRPVKGKKVACSMNWTPAEALETPILERLGRVLEDQGYLDSIELKIVKMNEGREHDWKTEKGSLEADLARVESEIKKTIQLQTKCDDPTVDDAFKDTLRELSDKKREKKVRLEELNSLLSDLVNPKEAREAIRVNVAAFRKAFAKATGTIRKRLLGLVFDGLTLGNCELNLYYNETVAFAEAVQQLTIQKSSEGSSGDSPLNSKILKFKSSVRRNATFGLSPRGGRDQKVFLQSVVGIGRGNSHPTITNS